MPKLAVDGIRLHYVERPGGGESIVFAHGHHGTHHAWDDLIAAFPAPYRALAFDLRGCGGSDKPADGYTSADYAGDLLGAAEALALGPFTLVGYSLGGVAAVQAALDRPDRIRRLVLVAVAALDGIPPERPLPEHPPAPREPRRAGLVCMMARPLSVARVEQLLDDEESWTREASRGAIDGLRPLRLGGRLGELTIPSLVVVGDRDRLLEANLAVAARLPNAGLQVYHRASHLLPMELPGQVADLIADFMTTSG